MTRWIFIGLGGLCAVLALWLWAVSGQRDRAETRADLWEKSAQSSQVALDELQRTYHAVSEALKERDEKMVALNKSLTSSRRKLKELEYEKSIADWGHTPVPDAVSGMLKDSTHATGNPPCSP